MKSIPTVDEQVCKRIFLRKECVAPQAFGVISIALGVNSKAYGDNSKDLGDRIHPYKKA